MRSKIVIIFTLILAVNLAETFRLKITKIVCNNTDKDFATVKICRLKAVSRDVQYIQMYLKYHKLPITAMAVRFRFLKKANGYKPFLYDFTLKCSFLKHLNPLTDIVWTWFKDASNLNHSCPFTDDFEVKRLENRYIEDKLRALPVPDGDYAFIVSSNLNNKLRLNSEFYATVQN